MDHSLDEGTGLGLFYSNLVKCLQFGDKLHTVSNYFPLQNKKSTLIARTPDLNIPANHPIRGCINTAPSQSKVSSTSPLDDPTTQAQVF